MLPSSPAALAPAPGAQQPAPPAPGPLPPAAPMTLDQARAAAPAALSSLSTAYDTLLRTDSCTAVEPLPDCLADARAADTLAALAGACAVLLVALPVVGAAAAYSGSPAKRRRGAGAVLDWLEGAARRGGAAVDVADLEWVEEVEERTTAAVVALEALRAAVVRVVGAGAGGPGVEGEVAAAAAAARARLEGSRGQLRAAAKAAVRAARAVLETCGAGAGADVCR